MALDTDTAVAPPEATPVAAPQTDTQTAPALPAWSDVSSRMDERKITDPEQRRSVLQNWSSQVLGASAGAGPATRAKAQSFIESKYDEMDAAAKPGFIKEAAGGLASVAGGVALAPSTAIAGALGESRASNLIGAAALRTKNAIDVMGGKAMGILTGQPTGQLDDHFADLQEKIKSGKMSPEYLHEWQNNAQLFASNANSGTLGEYQAGHWSLDGPDADAHENAALLHNYQTTLDPKYFNELKRRMSQSPDEVAAEQMSGGAMKSLGLANSPGWVQGMIQTAADPSSLAMLAVPGGGEALAGKLAIGAKTAFGLRVAGDAAGMAALNVVQALKDNPNASRADLEHAARMGAMLGTVGGALHGALQHSPNIEEKIKSGDSDITLKGRQKDIDAAKQSLAEGEGSQASPFPRQGQDGEPLPANVVPFVQPPKDEAPGFAGPGSMKVGEKLAQPEPLAPTPEALAAAKAAAEKPEVKAPEVKAPAAPAGPNADLKAKTAADLNKERVDIFARMMNMNKRDTRLGQLADRIEAIDKEIARRQEPLKPQADQAGQPVVNKPEEQKQEVQTKPAEISNNKTGQRALVGEDEGGFKMVGEKADDTQRIAKEAEQKAADQAAADKKQPDLAGTKDFALPADLSKSSPRYGNERGMYKLKFESDLDKALYTLAQDDPLKRNKRDADFLDAVKEHTGLTEKEIRKMGKDVKARIKELAKEAEPESEIVVEKSESAADKKQIDFPQQHAPTEEDPFGLPTKEEPTEPVNKERPKNMTPAKEAKWKAGAGGRAAQLKIKRDAAEAERTKAIDNGFKAIPEHEVENRLNYIDDHDHANMSDETLTWAAEHGHEDAAKTLLDRENKAAMDDIKEHQEAAGKVSIVKEMAANNLKLPTWQLAKARGDSMWSELRDMQDGMSFGARQAMLEHKNWKSTDNIRESLGESSGHKFETPDEMIQAIKAEWDKMDIFKKESPNKKPKARMGIVYNPDIASAVLAAGEKIKNWYDRAISGTAAGPQVAAIRQAGERAYHATEDFVNAAQRQLRSYIDRGTTFAGQIGQLTKAVREKNINDALDGSPGAMKALDPKIQSKVQAIRDRIDNNTRTIMGRVPENLRRILGSNLGKYIKTTYLIFDDYEKQMRAITPKMEQAAIDVIQKTWGDKKNLSVVQAQEVYRNMTDAQRAKVTGVTPADKYAAIAREHALPVVLTSDKAISLYNDLIDRQKLDRLQGFVHGTSTIAGRDVTSLLHKQDLAPEIQAVLGIDKDPVHRVGATLRNQARFIVNDNTQQALARHVLENQLVWTKEKPGDVRLVPEVKGGGVEQQLPLGEQKRGPLAPGRYPAYHDLFTTPEYRKIFYENQQSLYGTLGERAQVAYRVYATLNTLTKQAMVLGSPKAYAIQTTGEMAFAAANGRLSLHPTDWAKGVQEVARSLGYNDAKQITDSDLQKMRAELIQEGQLGHGVAEGLMKIDPGTNYATLIPGYQGLVERMGKTFGGFSNAVKVMGYFVEKRRAEDAIRWAHSDWTTEQVAAESQKQAGEIMRGTSHYYDNLPPALRVWSKLPGANIFAAFPYVVIRSSINSARFAARDMAQAIQTGNPYLYRNAAVRASALAATLSASWAAGSALSKSNGAPPDIQDAVNNNFVPPYDKKEDVVILKGANADSVRYIPLSYLDPLTLLTGAVQRSLSPKSGQSIVGSMMSEISNAFGGANPVWQAGADLMKNEDDHGQKIVGPLDEVGAGRKLWDEGKYFVGKTIEPAVIPFMLKAVDGLKGERNADGTPIDLGKQFASLFGWRERDINPTKEITYKAIDATKAIRGVQADMDKQLRTATNEQAQSNIKASAQQEIDQIYSTLAALRVGYLTLPGATADRFRAMAVNGGLTGAHLNAAMTGQAPAVKDPKPRRELADPGPELLQQFDAQNK